MFKKTKSALALGILAIVLCMGMLVGSTYAWFTDSVESGSNVITAGNLDLEVQYTLNGKDWKVLDDAKDLFQNDLWEPGHTEVVALKVTNAGSLALKYSVNMNILNETFGENAAGEDIVLSEILTVGTLVQEANQIGEISVQLAFQNENMFKGTTPFNANNVISSNVQLLPGSAHYVIIKVDMAETVGNEANAKDKDSVPSIDFGIEVLAAQYAYEEDSFGKDYDADAVYYDALVTTDAEFVEAINDANVKYIAIDGDVTYDWGGYSYENSKALLMKGKVIFGLDKEASITFKGYGSANPITDVTLKNIAVYDETVGDKESAWEHGHLEFVSLTAENVEFKNTIMLDGNSALTNCTLNNQTASWYGLWIEGGYTVLKDCEFTGTRAVKIHEAYGSDVKSVVIEDCYFACSEKPGVVIGDLDATTSVSIENCVFEGCKAGDQGLFIYESDTNVDSFEFAESNNEVK
jgi:predicted ribosomally synthesized peptide with SipW-like signal peptide